RPLIQVAAALAPDTARIEAHAPAPAIHRALRRRGQPNGRRMVSLMCETSLARRIGPRIPRAVGGHPAPPISTPHEDRSYQTSILRATLSTFPTSPPRSGPVRKGGRREGVSLRERSA